MYYRPRICTGLNLLGGLSLVGGVLLLLFGGTTVMLGTADDASKLARGLMGWAGTSALGASFEALVTGTLLLAASKVVELLAGIQAALYEEDEE